MRKLSYSISITLLPFSDKGRTNTVQKKLMVHMGEEILKETLAAVNVQTSWLRLVFSRELSVSNGGFCEGSGTRGVEENGRHAGRLERVRYFKKRRQVVPQTSEY